MLTQTEVVKWLREEVKAHRSQAELARKIGISRAYLNDILTGNRGPGESVLKYFGLAKQVTYVARKGR
jgi:transcriptional regulator with XRE-family HTH domain